MPESDEDYDRRNRDKFVRERGDYGGDRSRGRDFNADRTRRDYSNGIGGTKRSSRREEDFQNTSNNKRTRFDSASDSFEPQFLRKEETQPAIMLTFKKFLLTQDEALNEDDAISKYNEYKLEFKKQDCEKYFQAHKHEEWFRFKYHPNDSKALKQEQQECIQKRLEIFNNLLENGKIASTNLDYIKAENIIRLMDTVVIKLEGGTDENVEEMYNEKIDDESVIDVEKLKLKEETTPTSTTNASSIQENMEINSESQISAVSEELKTVKNGLLKDETSLQSMEVVNESDHKKKKIQLHKTCSIFFRSIPNSVKLDELVNLCKGHPGYLRIGLTNPLNEQKNQRRGWVTYRRDINIKEIFWSLKGAKFGGVDLGAIVNRDLKRRVRSVNGVTLHKSVAQNDIRQAAKLVALYDHKANLFNNSQQEDYKPISDLENAIVESKNPILSGLIDYLVEEDSAEEEELLRISSSQNPLSSTGDNEIKVILEEDPTLFKVLDKLILYLRIVHSVDFYNHCEYPNEDTMPNRLGLIHVRGPLPNEERFGKNENGKILITKSFIDNFTNSFNERLANGLLKHNGVVLESELEKLGKKEADKALEEFIALNCVKLGNEKWLCPLSGKKFKSPVFIEKHLHSKHEDKLNEVHDEVLFFNNYLSDPQRPHNQELLKPQQPVTLAPISNPQISDERRPIAGDMYERNTHRNTWSNNNDRGGMGRYLSNGGLGGPRTVGPGNRDFNRQRYFDPNQDMNGGRRDPRQPVTYRDLDAPEEIF